MTTQTKNNVSIPLRFKEVTLHQKKKKVKLIIHRIPPLRIFDIYRRKTGDSNRRYLLGTETVNNEHHKRSTTKRIEWKM